MNLSFQDVRFNLQDVVKTVCGNINLCRQWEAWYGSSLPYHKITKHEGFKTY